MELSTIAGETPIGLCGTGIIDAVGEAVRLGLIDENGTFEEPWFTDGMPVAEGRFRFRQEDVRQVQMGKAAQGSRRCSRNTAEETPKKS